MVFKINDRIHKYLTTIRSNDFQVTKYPNFNASLRKWTKYIKDVETTIRRESIVENKCKIHAFIGHKKIGGGIARIVHRFSNICRANGESSSPTASRNLENVPPRSTVRLSFSFSLYAIPKYTPLFPVKFPRNAIVKSARNVALGERTRRWLNI